MPSITNYVAPVVRKESFPTDISIEAEYQYNLRYLQQHQQSRPSNGDSVIERRTSSRSYNFSADSRRLSFDVKQLDHLPKYSTQATAPTETNCDENFSPMHATMNQRFTRHPSVCTPAPPSVSSSAKVNRGKTVASFDRNSKLVIDHNSDMQSASESCFQCEKRVYPLDRLSTGDRVYHKACFRCTECNRVLSATNFAKLEGLIFCKPHYIEKFRRRGKYEAVQKPGSSSCSMTPILKNNDSASSAAVSTTESGLSE